MIPRASPLDPQTTTGLLKPCRRPTQAGTLSSVFGVTYVNWAMPDLNRQPPPCKGGPLAD